MTKDVAYEIYPGYDTEQFRAMEMDMFIRGFGNDEPCVQFQGRFSVKENVLVLANFVRDEVQKLGGGATLKFTTGYLFYVKGGRNRYGDDRVLIIIDASERDEYGDVTSSSVAISSVAEKTAMDINIRVLGSMEQAVGMFNLLTQKFEAHRVPRINWHYRTHGRAVKTFYITQPTMSKDEYYPFIKPDLKTFYEDYIASTASILILLGPPGTGKTSFIRNMIYQYGMNTDLSYDDSILGSDDFFISFLTNKDSDLLVIEDADLLLTSREHDGNQVMSKLLNVSDGLIKIFSKKVIFTANITDINKIDDALLRPGRCFDVIDFRKLTRDEAKVAANAAGVPSYEYASETALSEVFNGQNHFKKRFGFRN